MAEYHAEAGRQSGKNLTKAERSQRARVAAFAMHSQHDTQLTTRRGREAWRAGFVDKVDPGRILSEDERQRRSEAAFREHMARLSYRAMRARKAAP